MAKHLIIIAQSVDEDDDHRGFFLDWLKEFSTQFDEVSVITVAEGAHTLPSNVHVYSLGKERGTSKFVQAFRFYRYLFKLLPGANGIFAHASPIFIILSWPFAALYRKKMILWYLHRSSTLKLRLALRMCDHLVTADASSLTVRSPKIIAVGHGIAVERFATPDRVFDIENRALRLLSVGRLAPIKDFSTFIRAIGLLRDGEIHIEARIVGQANMPEHQAEEQRLHELVHELALEDAVRFVGSVPYRDMLAQYRWADIVVGCAPHGGIDKALLEGMAAGCIIVTSNDVMRRYLEPYADALLFSYGNAEHLVSAIRTLPEHAVIGKSMVANVRQYHRLDAAIERISVLL